VADFRINVVVDPANARRGSRTVRRELQGVERAADRLRTQIRRAFAFGAIALAVRQVTNLADSFTNLQNRLRVVTDGQAELTNVTERLLGVSQRTRASFESTVELFARLAINARELGTTQQELVGFTQSINQAILISGASAKEANAALIQLSQGLASGSLRGDELRAVLEQLPVVADVIAQELGVTRGQLRELGAEGEITSEIIISAFQNAREELDQRFQRTIPTLQQSFQILRNSAQVLLGEFNEGAGITRGLATALRELALNLGEVVRVLITAGTVFAALRLAPVAQNAFNAAQAFLQFRAAVRAGNVVVLGSAEAQRQQAAAQVASIQSDIAKTRSTISQVAAERMRALAVTNTNEAFFAQRAIEGQLTALQAQHTRQTQALAAAQTQLASTTRAANIEANLFRRTLQRSIVAVRGLGAVIAANPVGALVVGLAAVITPLVVFRDEIQLSEDSLATLGDLGVVVFERLQNLAATFVNFFAPIFDDILAAAQRVFPDIEVSIRGILLTVADVTDNVVILFTGLFTTITTLFGGLPNVIGEVAINAVNGLIQAVENGINSIRALIQAFIQGLQQIGSAAFRFFNELQAAARLALSLGGQQAALQIADEAQANFRAQVADAFTGVPERVADNFADLSEENLFGRLENPFTGAGERLGNSLLDGLFSALDQTPARDFVEGLLADAEALAEERQAAAAAGVGGEGAVGAEAQDLTAFNEVLAQLAQEADLLQLGNREREVRAELLRIINDLEEEGIDLTTQENQQALQLVQSELERLQRLADQARLLDEIRGPRQDLINQQQTLNDLLRQGKITVEEYNAALRDNRIATAELSNTIGSGLESGLLKAQKNLEDLSTLADQTVVNAFQNAEDQLTSFLTTGEADFSAFVDSLLADVARLLSRQILLSLFGAGTTGGGLLSAALGVQAAQAGGNFPPDQPLLVGEEGPEIFNPATSGQVIPAAPTAAFAAGTAAGGQQAPPQVSVTAPPAQVTVVNVSSEEEVTDAINTRGGTEAVINVVRRNRRLFQQELGIR